MGALHTIAKATSKNYIARVCPVCGKVSEYKCASLARTYCSRKCANSDTAKYKRQVKKYKKYMSY